MPGNNNTAAVLLPSVQLPRRRAAPRAEPPAEGNYLGYTTPPQDIGKPWILVFPSPPDPTTALTSPLLLSIRHDMLDSDLYDLNNRQSTILKIRGARKPSTSLPPRGTAPDSRAPRLAATDVTVPIVKQLTGRDVLKAVEAALRADPQSYTIDWSSDWRQLIVELGSFNLCAVASVALANPLAAA